MLIFNQRKKGVFWVQFNLKDSLVYLSHHPIVASIAKHHANYQLKEDVTAITQDDRGEVDLEQKSDADQALALDVTCIQKWFPHQLSLVVSA